jgi:hypothetical protein
MNDKIIYKYKVTIFVILCRAFHQVAGIGGKDFLFNFLFAATLRPKFHALIAKCNEHKKLNLCLFEIAKEHRIGLYGQRSIARQILHSEVGYYNW